VASHGSAGRGTSLWRPNRSRLAFETLGITFVTSRPASASFLVDLLHVFWTMGHVVLEHFGSGNGRRYLCIFVGPSTASSLLQYITSSNFPCFVRLFYCST